MKEVQPAFLPPSWSFLSLQYNYSPGHKHVAASRVWWHRPRSSSPLAASRVDNTKLVHAAPAARLQSVRTNPEEDDPALCVMLLMSLNTSLLFRVKITARPPRCSRRPAPRLEPENLQPNRQQTSGIKGQHQVRPAAGWRVGEQRLHVGAERCFFTSVKRT